MTVNISLDYQIGILTALPTSRLQLSTLPFRDLDYQILYGRNSQLYLSMSLHSLTQIAGSQIKASLCLVHVLVTRHCLGNTLLEFTSRNSILLPAHIT
jgi:hypothetical protein